MADEWSELLFAARRKLEIAAYHHRMLTEWIGKSEASGAAPPPIEVQAHLEGLLSAICSAIEQTASAVNVALGLGLTDHNLDDAFKKIGEESVRDWWQDQRGTSLRADLRKFRNFMTHYVHKKEMDGLRWTVTVHLEKRQKKTKLVMEFAGQALDYGNELLALLDAVERCCDARTQRPARLT